MAISQKEGGLYQHSPTGFILHPLERSNPLSAGAVFFYSSRTNDYILVGGKTLLELVTVFKPEDMNGLLLLAKQLKVEQFGTGSGDTVRNSFLSSPADVEYDQVYGLRTTVADLVGFSGPTVQDPSDSQKQVATDALWAEIGFTYGMTVAQAIDMFYSGIPKQNESKVVSTINKAKKQVVSYFGARGINIGHSVPFYLKLVWSAPTQNWCLDYDSMAIGAGLGKTYAITSGDHILYKVARLGIPRTNNNTRYIEDEGIATALPKLVPIYTKRTMYEIESEGFSYEKHLYKVVPVTAIMGKPLHSHLLGLAGAHIGIDGLYRPIVEEDLTLKIIDDYISFKASTILDADLLTQQEGESVADFEKRQAASQKIVQARDTNVRATACAYSGLSMVYIMEVCDRAISGGKLAGGNTNQIFGEPFVGDVLVGMDATPQPLTHTFEKSY